MSVSEHERAFRDYAVPALEGYFAVVMAWFDVSAQATTTGIRMMRNEFIGAVDPFSEQLFAVRESLVSGIVPGDVIVDEDSRRWDILKIRDAKAGYLELRCRAAQVVT